MQMDSRSPPSPPLHVQPDSRITRLQNRIIEAKTRGGILEQSLNTVNKKVMKTEQQNHMLRERAKNDTQSIETSSKMLQIIEKESHILTKEANKSHEVHKEEMDRQEQYCQDHIAMLEIQLQIQELKLRCEELREVQVKLHEKELEMREAGLEMREKDLKMCEEDLEFREKVLKMREEELEMKKLQMEKYWEEEK